MSRFEIRGTYPAEGRSEVFEGAFTYMMKAVQSCRDMNAGSDEGASFYVWDRTIEEPLS